MLAAVSIVRRLRESTRRSSGRVECRRGADGGRSGGPTQTWPSPFTVDGSIVVEVTRDRPQGGCCDFNGLKVVVVTGECE